MLAYMRLFTHDIHARIQTHSHIHTHIKIYTHTHTYIQGSKRTLHHQTRFPRDQAQKSPKTDSGFRNHIHTYTQHTCIRIHIHIQGPKRTHHH
jgi:hypothetical protein